MRSLTRPTRRGLLAVGGAVTLAAVASACDGSPSTTADDEPARIDPDLRRVETVAAQARELAALVAGVAVAHPSLAPRVSAIAECHRAHLATLEDEDAFSASPAPTLPTFSGTPGLSTEAALKDLVAREQAHVTTLGAEAGVAESGALARLFASMAAGVGMYLPALTGGAA